MLAAFWAAIRHVRGNTSWHKTTHTGDHRLAEHLPRRNPLAVGTPAMDTF
jgi:hypothetical protein